VRSELEAEALVRTDYVSVADDVTLEELAGMVAGPAVLSLAAHVGATHLIDNVTLVP
jgi:pantothenate synthetase